MPLDSRFLKSLAGIYIGFCSLSAHADALKQAINIEMATNKSSIQSQKKIDQLSEQTRNMLTEYRSATRNAETLRIYNNYLEQLIQSQVQEQASMQQQLQEIEITQREIVPLILNMLDSLEKFISMDLPFLPEERQQRLSGLKQMVNRADITNAEKFRRILEAFQIENDYGNTIEAYRANIELDGVKSSVDFLRLGRVALYYQRLDGSESGFWNKEEKRWQTLDSDYNTRIRNGLRIARKETAPDLLTLPVPAPETAQ